MPKPCCINVFIKGSSTCSFIHSDNFIAPLKEPAHRRSQPNSDDAESQMLVKGMYAESLPKGTGVDFQKYWVGKPKYWGPEGGKK